MQGTEPSPLWVLVRFLREPNLHPCGFEYYSLGNQTFTPVDLSASPYCREPNLHPRGFECDSLPLRHPHAPYILTRFMSLFSACPVLKDAATSKIALGLF